ncbi:MFS transporter [Algihabitans albus]|uniref:MFS transporter n=1 Tax=Algihabitans albus TaxID=2164067 RepID=UPI0035CF4983
MGKHETDSVPWRALLVRTHASALALVCLGIWLHAADELVIATMMPAIVADIGGAGLIAWTLAFYELGSIIAGATAALLALRFGLRMPMTVSALAFAVGCTLAALAPSMPVLLAGRLVQGLGSGGLVALAFVAVGLFFPLRLTARVMAAMSALWGLSSFLGPLIGGLFVEYGSWRGGFWFFALQAAGLALWIATRRDGGRPDEASLPAMGFPGLRLLALAAAVVLVALAGTDIDLLQVPLLVAAGLLCLALFVWLDGRAGEDRLLPRAPAAVTRPTGAALVMVFCMSAATIPLAIYGPLLITSLHGSSALTAGYIIACSSIGWTLVAVAASGAAERHDPLLIVAGMGLTAASVLGLLYAIPNGPLWLIALFAAIEGGGFGLAWTFILRRARRLAAPGEIERVAGAIPTVQRIGYALGAALIGIVANAAGLADGEGAAVTAGVSSAIFLACLPLAALGLLAAVRFAFIDAESPGARSS